MSSQPTRHPSVIPAPGNVNLYSVYDKAAGAYSNPLYQPNDALAIRSFQYACTQTDSNLYTHPQDFQLYYVGTFNSNTGEYYQDELRPLMTATQAITLTEAESAQRETASMSDGENNNE